jgi:hypothetical protein
VFIICRVLGCVLVVFEIKKKDPVQVTVSE